MASPAAIISALHSGLASLTCRQQVRTQTTDSNEVHAGWRLIAPRAASCAAAGAAADAREIERLRGSVPHPPKQK